MKLTKRQIAIAEHFIKKETKRLMREEAEIPHFVVWRKENNTRREIAKYNSAEADNRVAALPNKYSQHVPAANVFKSTYDVTQEKY